MRRSSEQRLHNIESSLPYQNVLFITEDKEHTIQARRLGMMTIRLKHEEEYAEVDKLIEMIPLIHLFILTSNA